MRRRFPMADTRIVLSENELPRQWYNILADFRNPPPPVLHPGTLQPIGPTDLAPLFPMACILQEVSTERWIDIPDEVRDVYKLWRPSPLYRALRLEKHLQTPAQTYYNKQEGIRRIATETGAGQWGSALAMACRMFGLECTVYMVKVSYHQKPYRRMMMNTWGAEVFASPSDRTHAGQSILAAHPDSPGSLGIAISEAVEDAATHSDTNYSLGSVLNHVMLHQTVIGQEAKRQMDLADEQPDVVIGCFGGGSNFGGLALPYVLDKFAGSAVRIMAVEPAACPSLTRGAYAYDYGDTAKLTPLIKMYTLGHDFVPPGIHAGGLRYHGASPLLSHLLKHGWLEAKAYKQTPVFEAAVQFAQTEGILPAPESAHAIRAAMDEALAAKEEGRPRVILFCLSGHGHFDMSAYDNYLSGKLQDYEHPGKEIDEAMAAIPS